MVSRYQDWKKSRANELLILQQANEESGRKLLESLCRNEKLLTDVASTQDQLRRQQDISDALQQKAENLKQELNKLESQRKAELSAHFQHIRLVE